MEKAARPWAGILALGWAVFVLYFLKLGASPLASTDTALHAAIARRMAAGGPWLTPELHGQPWFEHTPPFLWLTAGSFELFGFGPGAARLPGALAAAVTIAATQALAWLLRGPRAGLVAGLALATTEMFFRQAGRVRMDVPLTAAITLAVLCLAWARRRDLRALVGFGLFTGAAIFLKGPMGLAPLAALVAALVLGGPAARRRLLGSGWLWLSLILIPLVPAPWVLHELQAGQGWYERYVLHQLIRLPVGDGGSQRDLLVVVRVLFTTYWPWLPLALLATLQALRSLRGVGDTLAEVLGWAGFVTLALSLAAHHPDYYLLPMYPALAVLVGFAAEPYLSTDRRVAIATLTLGGAASLLAVALLATPLDLRGTRLERETGAVQALAPEIARRIGPSGPPVGVFGLHPNRSVWALELFVDTADEPTRLDSPAAVEAFVRNRGGLVVMPAGSAPTTSSVAASLAEAAGLALVGPRAVK